jgi:hypothetical protein
MTKLPPKIGYMCTPSETPELFSQADEICLKKYFIMSEFKEIINSTFSSSANSCKDLMT